MLYGNHIKIARLQEDGTMTMRFTFFLLAALAFNGMFAPRTYADGKANLSRVGIRKGQFITLETGNGFTPKGCNFIRLRHKTPGTIAHSTFDDQYYNGSRMESMLRDLAVHGFNTVRVFIDPVSPAVGLFETRETTRLSPVYMANVLDLLQRARDHGVYVIFVFSMWGPNNTWLHRGPAKATMVSGPNELYFRAGAAETRAALLSEFVKAIKAYDSALLSVVLAYEIQNELCYFVKAEPLSLADGIFRYGDKTYNLSSEQEIQQLMDDVSVHWCNATVKEVRRIDPQALVSISVFTFRAVGRTGPNRLRKDRTTDNRIPARPLALAESSVSYVDIHLYPHGPNTMQEDLRSIEFDALRRKCLRAGKPLLMGEFGAFKHDYPTLKTAVRGVTQHAKEAYDAGFVGFLYWTYDTDEQKRLWNAKSGKGDILKALAKAKLAEHGAPADTDKPGR